MGAAKEEAAGRDVADAAVNTLDLTGTTQIMDGFIEWTAQTSGGVSMEKFLTSLGAMGACMYSTSAIVIRTPATPRGFSKAGKMMGRS